jgi:hypothetical protein
VSASIEDLRSQLEATLDNCQGTGVGDHDALIMVSGGKDSAILLHLIKQRFPGLRQLAYTVDNGFMSPVAMANAHQTVSRLGVDHIVSRPDSSVYARGFRFACTHLEAGKGCFATVDRIDGTLGFDLAKTFAARNGIPLVVFGFNPVQMSAYFGVDGWEVPDQVVREKTTSVIGRDLREIFDEVHLKYFWDPECHGEDRIPRMVAPLCAWQYNEEEVRERVIELGLIDPGNDSALVTNNSVIQMMVVFDYLHLGYADFEPQFADMVRRGEADARYWRNVFEMLEYSAKTGWMIEQDLNRIATSLDIDREQIVAARRRGAPR